MMKILLVSLNHAPEETGIGKYHGEMARWLAARGHRVSVITAPPYYPSWKIASGYSAVSYRHEHVDGADVWRAPLYVPQTPSGLKRLVHHVSFALSSAPLLLWKIAVGRPDVVLLTAPPLLAAPFVLLTAFLGRVPACLHVQDFEVDAAFRLGILKKPWAYRLALKIEAFLLKRFAKVSAVSPSMRAKLLEKGVSEAKAVFIPNWGDVDVFANAPEESDWQKTVRPTPETIVALYSGNIGRKQGLETIIDAARLLEGKGVPVRFVISGDGAGRKDIEARAKGLSSVHFLPLQPFDVFVSLMKAADIHLLPQRADAADLVMPSKLCNILASGRPVVAGASAGTQVFEAVQGCGFAVPPENVEAFAEAIHALAKDPTLRATFGAEGRKRALAEWSRDGALLRMEKLLLGEGG